MLKRFANEKKISVESEILILFLCGCPIRSSHFIADFNTAGLVQLLRSTLIIGQSK